MVHLTLPFLPPRPPTSLNSVPGFGVGGLGPVASQAACTASPGGCAAPRGRGLGVRKRRLPGFESANQAMLALEGILETNLTSESLRDLPRSSTQICPVTRAREGRAWSRVMGSRAR